MRHPVSLYRSLWLGFAAALAVAGGAQAVQKKDTPVRVAENFTGTPRPAMPAPSRAANSPAQEYVIGREDVLAIDVWREPEISRVEPVRPDGRITLPLAGEVRASGKTPSALEREIGEKLSGYIHDPAGNLSWHQELAATETSAASQRRPRRWAFPPPRSQFWSTILALSPALR